MTSAAQARNNARLIREGIAWIQDVIAAEIAR
jgi:hypothetical protein